MTIDTIVNKIKIIGLDEATPTPESAKLSCYVPIEFKDENPNCTPVEKGYKTPTPESAKVSCYVSVDDAATNPNCEVVKATPTIAYNTYPNGNEGLENQVLELLPNGQQNLINQDKSRTVITLPNTGFGYDHKFANSHVKDIVTNIGGVATLLLLAGAMYQVIHEKYKK